MCERPPLYRFEEQLTSLLHTLFIVMSSLHGNLELEISYLMLLGLVLYDAQEHHRTLLEHHENSEKGWIILSSGYRNGCLEAYWELPIL